MPSFLCCHQRYIVRTLRLLLFRWFEIAACKGLINYIGLFTTNICMLNCNIANGESEMVIRSYYYHVTDDIVLYSYYSIVKVSYFFSGKSADLIFKYILLTIQKRDSSFQSQIFLKQYFYFISGL